MRAGFFCPVVIEMKALMRFQPFIGGAMLLLLFGLGVWVALQFLEMNVDSYRRKAAVDKARGARRPPTRATIKVSS